MKLLGKYLIFVMLHLHSVPGSVGFWPFKKSASSDDSDSINGDKCQSGRQGCWSNNKCLVKCGPQYKCKLFRCKLSSESRESLDYDYGDHQSLPSSSSAAASMPGYASQNAQDYDEDSSFMGRYFRKFQNRRRKKRKWRKNKGKSRKRWKKIKLRRRLKKCHSGRKFCRANKTCRNKCGPEYRCKLFRCQRVPNIGGEFFSNEIRDDVYGNDDGGKEYSGEGEDENEDEDEDEDENEDFKDIGGRFIRFIQGVKKKAGGGSKCIRRPKGSNAQMEKSSRIQRQSRPRPSTALLRRPQMPPRRSQSSERPPHPYFSGPFDGGQEPPPIRPPQRQRLPPCLGCRSGEDDFCEKLAGKPWWEIAVGEFTNENGMVEGAKDSLGFGDYDKEVDEQKSWQLRPRPSTALLRRPQIPPRRSQSSERPQHPYFFGPFDGGQEPPPIRPPQRQRLPPCLGCRSGEDDFCEKLAGKPWWEIAVGEFTNENGMVVRAKDSLGFGDYDKEEDEPSGSGIMVKIKSLMRMGDDDGDGGESLERIPPYLMDWVKNRNSIAAGKDY